MKLGQNRGGDVKQIKITRRGADTHQDARASPASHSSARFAGFEGLAQDRARRRFRSKTALREADHRAGPSAGRLANQVGSAISSIVHGQTKRIPSPISAAPTHSKQHIRQGGSWLCGPGRTLRYIMVQCLRVVIFYRWPLSFSGARRHRLTSNIGRTNTMTCEKTNMRGSSAPPAQGCIFSIEKPASYWARTTTKTDIEREPADLIRINTLGAHASERRALTCRARPRSRQFPRRSDQSAN
jgi:hypothetical protein